MQIDTLPPLNAESQILSSAPLVAPERLCVIVFEQVAHCVLHDVRPQPGTRDARMGG